MFNSSIIKSAYLEDGVQDKSNKGAWVFLAIRSISTLAELSSFNIIIPKMDKM